MLSQPSDAPADRLHASAHAWANDTATDVTIGVIFLSGERIDVATRVAEPGPLIAIKLRRPRTRRGAAGRSRTTELSLHKLWTVLVIHLVRHPVGRRSDVPASVVHGEPLVEVSDATVNVVADQPHPF